METFQSLPYIGYVYPNETVLPWSLLIVIYPYLTGLVAGAFSVSSLYQVFKFKVLEPVAHFSLLVALACMICVPLPLLLHLGQPTRAFNAMITPHWTSAFAIFSYAACFYIFLLLLEVWFVFRPQMVDYALHGKTAVTRLFYRVLALGSTDVSEKALAADNKWIFALAILGIPGAHGLHGYVGFVFGSLKSREWWSSDMMPAIFLFSAIISGTALLVVLYVLMCKIRKVPVDLGCLKALTYSLWGFLMFAMLLEFVEFASLVYRGREGIDWIMKFVTGPLIPTFWIMQVGIGSVIPLLLITTMIIRRTTGKALVWGMTTCACLVLMAVLSMRWNVVIGGQEISKTGKGLLTYIPPMLGREGWTTGILVMCCPAILLTIFLKLFPPFPDQHKAIAH